MSFPQSSDEAERLRALRRQEILDAAPEEAFDRVTHLAASLFAVPGAFISLIDADRQRFKSRIGMPTDETPSAAALAAHALLDDDVRVVPDARRDPDLRDNPHVTGEPHIRFYAAAPLLSREGHRLGVLGIIDRKARGDFSDENRRQLQTLARLVVSELELRIELGARSRAEGDLELVNQLMLAIAEASSVNTAMETSLNLICRAVGATYGRVWTAVGRSGRCQLIGAWGRSSATRSRSPGRRRRPAALTLNGSLVGMVLTENRRQVVPDIAKVARRFAAARDARAMGIRALICVPVRQDGRNFALTFLFEQAPPDIERLADRIELLAGKVRPVLARKLAEERIALLQSVVLHADDAVMVAEIDGGLEDFGAMRIVYASPAITRMTGYEPDELHGRSPNLLWGEGAQAKAVAGLYGTAGHGERSRLELACRRKDGTTFWGDISAVPVTEEGTGERKFIALLRDTTERRRLEEALRQSESTFRLLFSGNPIPMWAYDLETRRFLEVNNAAIEQYGYRRAEFLAMTIDDIAPADPVPPRPGESTAAPDVGRLGIRRHRKADGSEITVDAVSHRLEFDGHQAAIMAALDVTEQKRAEEEIRRAKETAEAASRAKSELLANMSHELRTPLNAIIGFSEIMQASLFGPLGSSKYDGYIADIRHSAGHLLTVITDILDLAKIEANSFRLHEGVISPSEIIVSALRLVKPRADGVGVLLAYDKHHDDAAIKADETALKRVLINLLANAVKFSEPGGAVIVRSEFDAQGRLAISVSDQGIGMTPEEIPIALTPFRQVNSGLQRKYEGTGLGLPIAKQLVEMHGGTLTIASARDAGTTVTVLLPAARVMTAAA